MSHTPSNHEGGSDNTHPSASTPARATFTDAARRGEIRNPISARVSTGGARGEGTGAGTSAQGGGRGQYNIPDEDDKKEYFESEEKLSTGLDTLATWVRESKHLIVCTGAGISTGEGIPDFRSGMDTKLPTGPGVWELRDAGQARDRRYKTTTITHAQPTLAHRALVALYEQGHISHVVSQNVDGLHVRSGLISGQSVSELHGNTYLERCRDCGNEYLRNYQTRTAHHVYDHVTGRKCEACGGVLLDSIVNFGESLPEKALTRAFEEAAKCDLCIVLGTSLRVSPANQISLKATCKNPPARLVIANLQRTPLDPIADLHLHATCDDVMGGLMQRLGLGHVMGGGTGEEVVVVGGEE